MVFSSAHMLHCNKVPCSLSSTAKAASIRLAPPGGMFKLLQGVHLFSRCAKMIQNVVFNAWDFEYMDFFLVLLRPGRTVKLYVSVPLEL